MDDIPKKHIYLDKSGINNYLSSQRIGIIDTIEDVSGETSETSLSISTAIKQIRSKIGFTESEYSEELQTLDILDSYRFEKLVDELEKSNLLWGPKYAHLMDESTEVVERYVEKNRSEIQMYQLLKERETSDGKFVPNGKFIRLRLNISPIYHTRLNLAMKIKKNLYYDTEKQSDNDFDKIESRIKEFRYNSGKNLVMVGRFKRLLFIFTLNPNYLREPKMEVFGRPAKTYTVVGRIRASLSPKGNNLDNEIHLPNWPLAPKLSSEDTKNETSLQLTRELLRQLPGKHTYTESYESTIDTDEIDGDFVTYEIDPIAIYW